MARARNIKPSLFKNEVLGTADPLLTLLFESLWCLADKAGRLEDRPLRIKAETFPYREGVDIIGLLTDLERLGFVRRYQVSHLKLIEVVNFAKHQKPHHTEKESELPAFATSCHVTVKNPCKDALIPDSLNTDSLIPENGKPAETAAEEIPVVRRIWKDGVDLLKQSSMTEAQARPLLGRLAKDFGNEILAECIAVAQAKNPADPRAFLIGCLNERSGKNNRIKSRVGAHELSDCGRCSNTRHILENGEEAPCPKCDEVNYQAFHALKEEFAI